jgi:hypothetical protein
MTLHCRSRACCRAGAAVTAAVVLGPASVSAQAAPAIVERHAPLVWLHSSEEFWPMSASGFVGRSRLGWSRRSGCDDTLVAGPGEVRAGRLGARANAHGGPYRQSITSARPSSGPDLCLPGPFARSAHEYTRPKTRRAEGFFLDLANGDRRGAAPRCPPEEPACKTYGQAPVYFEYSVHRYITYWYFFGYSTPLGEGIGGHEGDWERIAVRLDASNRPTEVAYYQHGGDPTPKNGKSVRWSELVKDGAVRQQRPIVFIARGTHASYPKECRKVLGVRLCGTDRLNAGRLWTTSEHLRDVTVQPWYGFGGAWGSVSPVHENFTGPAGPGPNGLDCHKPPVPRAWLPEGSCA